MLNQLVVRYVSLILFFAPAPFWASAVDCHLLYLSFFVSFVTPLYQFRSFRVAHSVVVCVTVIETGANRSDQEVVLSALLHYWPGSVYHTVLPPPGNLSLHLAIQIPLNR